MTRRNGSKGMEWFDTRWRRLKEDARNCLASLRRSDIPFLVYTGVACALYSPFLLDLVRLARHSSLASHLPLVPFISLYLVLTRRMDQARLDSEVDAIVDPQVMGAPSHHTSAGFLLPRPGQHARFRLSGIIAAALLLLAALRCVWTYRERVAPLPDLALNDALVLPTLSLVLVIYAGVFLFYGMRGFGRMLFPLLFLLFTVPMGSALESAISTWLVAGSADALEQLLTLVQAPYFRQGTVFELAGLTIDVAPECSGIRSSWVLFMTSLLLGDLLLPRTWQRVLLVLFVVPLGLYRNGFRILCIAMLTIHVHQGVIDGPLHSRGGPFFFVLALAVLFAAALLLRRFGKRRARSR